MSASLVLRLQVCIIMPDYKLLISYPQDMLLYAYLRFENLVVNVNPQMNCPDVII